jgi:hypothetical protein
MLVATSICAFHISASSEYFAVQLGALSVILFCVVELAVLVGRAIGSLLDWIASGNASCIDRTEAGVLETASQLLLQDTILLLHKGAVGAVVTSVSLVANSIIWSLPTYLNWTHEGRVGDWLCHLAYLWFFRNQQRLELYRRRISRRLHLHCTNNGQQPHFSFATVWKFVAHDLFDTWREVGESIESLQQDIEDLLGQIPRLLRPDDWISMCNDAALQDVGTYEHTPCTPSTGSVPEYSSSQSVVDDPTDISVTEIRQHCKLKSNNYPVRNLVCF